MYNDIVRRDGVRGRERKERREETYCVTAMIRKRGSDFWKRRSLESVFRDATGRLFITSEVCDGVRCLRAVVVCCL